MPPWLHYSLVASEQNLVEYYRIAVYMDVGIHQTLFGIYSPITFAFIQTPLGHPARTLADKPIPSAA